MKPVQFFDDDYLARCRQATLAQTLEFLENYRKLQGTGPTKSKLISLKVPTPLLAAFRQQCVLRGLRYQTQIKALMRAWLEGNTIGS